MNSTPPNALAVAKLTQKSLEKSKNTHQPKLGKLAALFLVRNASYTQFRFSTSALRLLRIPQQPWSSKLSGRYSLFRATLARPQGLTMRATTI